MPVLCPHCGYDGPTLDPGTCGRCGVVFARVHAEETGHSSEPAVSAEPSPLPEAEPEERPEADVQPAAPENRWALPLAFATGLLLNSNGCGRLIVYSSASNWVHELGHASWRWLNGRSAVPVLFFTFYSDPARSAAFTLLVLGGLVALFLWARTEECTGLMTVAVLFLLLFAGLGVAMPAAKEHLLESFAGIFGEFWIATLWVVLFYYRFPSVVQWARLRWAFLFLGACAYVRICGVFWVSRHDMTRLPWGSFAGGDGDLDRLLAGGWLVSDMRSVYFRVAAVCGAVMLGHYLYFLRQAARDPPSLQRQAPAR